MSANVQIIDNSTISRVTSEYCQFGDEYIFARITPGTPLPIDLVSPKSAEGMMLLLCRDGEYDIEINVQPVHLQPRSLVFASQHTVIKLFESGTLPIDAYLLRLSPEFMRHVSIDLNALSTSPFSSENKRNEIVLTENEFDMMERIFELFRLNTESNTNPVYIRAIARTLAATIFYQVMQVSSSRTDEAPPQRHMSRRMNYVADFMSLVHKHFRKHRSVGYYAEKLYISSKYLSLIIKESTGRSAAEWIDECVIMEAKNLLRFSGKNVQQIAYELNFNNQSSFGKYFKNITGMSPTQFQQS